MKTKQATRLKSRNYRLGIADDKVGDLEYRRIKPSVHKVTHVGHLSKKGISPSTFLEGDVVLIVDGTTPDWVMEILDDSIIRIMTRYRLSRSTEPYPVDSTS
jgi:hypothetical protein